MDYNYLNNYYKIIAIDLSKQQELYADLKVIQQFNFTGNLNWVVNVNDNTIMFSIKEEAKESILGNWESIVILFCFNVMLI